MMSKDATPVAESVELLPCPFCGGTDGDLVETFTRANEDLMIWAVECERCGAERASDASQHEARTFWNTRDTAAIAAAHEAGRAKGVREAAEVARVLCRLETACDDLVANRSTETYRNMVDCDRATPYLHELDEARHEARDILRALSKEPTK